MIMSDPATKWNFPIPYFIDKDVSHLLVDSALHMISKETCIRFKKYKKLLRGLAGLHYYYGDDCSSVIGKEGEGIWQTISIGEGCDTIGRIQHETMHALGFYHEHSRYDRDKYIQVLSKNVHPDDYSNNFKKVSVQDSNTFGVPFDFGSVMLYEKKMYSFNGGDTMLSHDYRYRYTYGLLDHVSYGDVKMLNFYYCSKRCHIKLKCMNEGYQDPNNCKKCKCVKGFIGPLCNMLSLPTKECGLSTLYATNKMKLFGTSGKKNCIYHIITHKHKKIAIKVLASSFFPNNEGICHSTNSLEIKYWSNKVSTGARFCLNTLNFMFYSDNNHVIIYYRSSYELNFFNIVYKSIPINYKVIKVLNEFSKYRGLTPKSSSTKCIFDKNNLINGNTQGNGLIKKSLLYYANDDSYRKKKMISNDSKAKWNFPIPYYIDNYVSHLLVDSALHMIEKETCIKFKKYKKMKASMSEIRYYYGYRCSSPIGKQGKGIWQSISIGEGCFYHEHSRYDRDKYIYFAYKNIDKDYHINFEKVSKKDSNTFDVPFDFGSIMMYERRTTSINGGDTMISRDYRYQYTYGIGDQVSYGDVKMLNYYYCSEKCRTKINCKNGGYQDPNNCNKCKCVKGFIGPLCNILSLPTNECGQSRLYSTYKVKELITA
uniref:Metalloendopeptidase n=2 Tax=Strongyloides stercoralis TaxID=6248 RepID=A0AAF5D318_STRER